MDRTLIGRITLWGVDGEPFPLATPGKCREGVALTSTPGALSGQVIEHLFDEATGEHKGLAQPTPQPLRLDLQIEGPYPREHYHTLMQALGDGSRPVAISAVSAEMGSRWKHYYFQEVSEIDWHGSSPGSPLVKLSVLLVSGKRAWRRFPEKVTLDHTTEWGEVTIPIDGNMDVWPRFTISGTHEGVTIKLHPLDDEQVVPAGGWVIDSHPERRIVANLEGEQLFNGFVPFWPEPVRNYSGEGTLTIMVESPGTDFKMDIEYTPEASRAW